MFTNSRDDLLAIHDAKTAEQKKVRPGFGTMVIIIAVAALGLLVGGGWYIERYYGLGDPGYACTRDAKICPDGSSVGRTGPKCEFAPCPGEAEVTSFEDCVTAGGSIAGGVVPNFCEMPDGRRFVEDISSEGGVDIRSDESLCKASGGVYESCPPCLTPGLCAPCPAPCRCSDGKFWKSQVGCVPITTIDTSIWKTYRNDQYGFEFQYPSLGLEQRVVETSEGFELQSNSIYSPDYFGADLTIYIQDNTRNLDLKTWLNEDDLFKNGNFKAFKREDGLEYIQQISGVPYPEGWGDPDSLGFISFLYAALSPDRKKILIFFPAYQDRSYLEYIDQTFNSFKFIR